MEKKKKKKIKYIYIFKLISIKAINFSKFLRNFYIIN